MDNSISEPKDINEIVEETITSNQRRINIFAPVVSGKTFDLRRFVENSSRMVSYIDGRENQLIEGQDRKDIIIIDHFTPGHRDVSRDEHNDLYLERYPKTVLLEVTKRWSGSREHNVPLVTSIDPELYMRNLEHHITANFLTAEAARIVVHALSSNQDGFGKREYMENYFFNLYERQNYLRQHRTSAQTIMNYLINEGLFHYVQQSPFLKKNTFIKMSETVKSALPYREISRSARPGDKL
jgi:hypothetical protein